MTFIPSPLFIFNSERMMKDKLKYLEIPIFMIAVCWMLVHFTYCVRGDLSHSRDILTGYYAETDNTLDLVLVGTSSTFSAVIPIELWGEYGIPSYDFCNNVMFENTMPYAIREMDKTQDPKLVVIDVAPFMFRHYSERYLNKKQYFLRYNTDAYKLSKNRIDLINAILPGDVPKLYYYLDFMFYHNNEILPEYFNWEKHSVYKGYNNLGIQVSFTEEDWSDESFSDYELPAKEKAFLDALLSELSEHDFEVLFFCGPYFRCEEKIEAAKREEWVQAYLEGKGYSFLNMDLYRDEIGIDPQLDYSLDYNHYNLESAEKITHFLGDYLCRNYDFENKSSLKEYSGWNEDYEEWKNVLYPQEEERLREWRESFTGLR